MISAQQKCLEVADGNMHPGQPFVRPIRRRHPCGMMLGFADFRQGGQRIATHQLTGREMTLNKPCYSFMSDSRDLLHGDKPSTLVPVLNRHQYWGFTFGAATSLSTAATTHQGIVNLNQIVQPIDTIPVSHGNADLTQYPASRNPGNFDLFGKAYGRNATLVRGGQVNRPEPFNQRQIGGVKQRPRRKRGLVMALGALVGMARADDIAMIMPAARATESFRPALLRQRLHAGFFRFCQSSRLVSNALMIQSPYIIDLKAFGRKY